MAARFRNCCAGTNVVRFCSGEKQSKTTCLQYNAD
jgi:hypothetical protein